MTVGTVHKNYVLMRNPSTATTSAVFHTVSGVPGDFLISVSSFPFQAFFLLTLQSYVPFPTALRA